MPRLWDEATEGDRHEATRVHDIARRCGGRVADVGARANARSDPLPIGPVAAPERAAGVDGHGSDRARRRLRSALLRADGRSDPEARRQQQQRSTRAARRAAASILRAERTREARRLPRAQAERADLPVRSRRFLARRLGAKQCVFRRNVRQRRLEFHCHRFHRHQPGGRRPSPDGRPGAKRDCLDLQERRFLRRRRTGSISVAAPPARI